MLEVSSFGYNDNPLLQDGIGEKTVRYHNYYHYYPIIIIIFNFTIKFKEIINDSSWKKRKIIYFGRNRFR